MKHQQRVFMHVSHRPVEVAVDIKRLAWDLRFRPLNVD